MLLLISYRRDRMTGNARTEILQGTLDLLVLKTLDALGPLHGFGIARRIEQVSGAALQLNQGTLYPALVRLAQRGWISSSWGVSANNRRARFYSLTKTGQATRYRNAELGANGLCDRAPVARRRGGVKRELATGDDPANSRDVFQAAAGCRVG